MHTVDPFVNLAIEQWLMESKRSKGAYMLVWRSSPCVVIGRHQDPQRECNMDLVRELNIPLVRRYSGGGAVYQDLGNSNYSLITDLETFKRERACELIIGAMKRVGVELRSSERWDLWREGGKVSGSAFRMSRGKAYHHGTMLRETCLRTLLSVLDSKADQRDMGEGYAVGSVKSPVANVHISHEQFCTAVDEEFEAGVRVEMRELPREAMRYYEELKDEEWILRRKIKL